MKDTWFIIITLIYFVIPTFKLVTLLYYFVCKFAPAWFAPNQVNNHQWYGNNPEELKVGLLKMSLDYRGLKYAPLIQGIQKRRCADMWNIKLLGWPFVLQISAKQELVVDKTSTKTFQMKITYNELKVGVSLKCLQIILYGVETCTLKEFERDAVLDVEYNSQSWQGVTIFQMKITNRR